MSLPDWAAARLSLDRFCRNDFQPDEYFSDVQSIFEQALPTGLVPLEQVSTSASSVEVLFERRSGSSVVLWDVDFTKRLDGMLALIFCDEDDDIYDYQGLGIAAFSNQAASLLLTRDPPISNFILSFAYDFSPDNMGLTVEDDIRMDRYRRLVRAYVALHELAHVIFRTLPEKIPEIDAVIQNTVANIRPSQIVQQRIPSSEVDKELEARGLLLTLPEVDEVIRQIEDHLRRPKDYEEIWCDVFASEHLLGWALENDFQQHECIVADDLLHLLLAGRMQWKCFFDRRNVIGDWQNSHGLHIHENRTNIRGFLMAANATRSWHLHNFSRSAQEASETMAMLTTKEGDLFKKRFLDRNHLALGILGGLERADVFEAADRGWNELSVTQRDEAILEMFDILA